MIIIIGIIIYVFI